jgi:hypothetical protein
MNTVSRLVSIKHTALAAALLTAALLPGIANASEGRATGNGALTARSFLDFRIVIPAIVRITGMQQPSSVTIEPRHVAQGYVDLDEATSLKLTTNSRLGCELSVGFNRSLIARVVVKSGAQEHEVAATNGSFPIAQQKTDNHPVSIGYRLYLNSDVVAGNYPWPLALKFTPRAV